jgi:hypothetical protein
MAQKVMLRIIPPTGPGSGDPTTPATVGKEEMILSANKPKIDQDFDVRDRLAELVGKGNTLNADDKSAILGSLATRYGKDIAMRIMNHAYIFNQRPDIQKLPMEDKLRAFYTIGSNDPDVHNVINSAKNLGYGVVHGFRNSSSDINKQLTNRVPVITEGSDKPEIKKKVMLKIGQ